MKKKNLLADILAAFCVFLSLVPFVTVIVNSFYQIGEGISFQAYYDVFLGTPQYLMRFWRSLGICLCISAGQMILSLLAGYGFARYRFPGKNVLFFLLMILMVLPLQVTLVPNYIMMNQLGLLGTDASLILPCICIPLGTFIMTQSIKTIPEEIIDEARLNGCGIFRILIHIVVPMNRGSLICVGLLSFLDGWNMVEQPIAYLRDFAKYPISVALAYVSPENPVQQFVCCILVMIPALILFSCFNKEMIEGIIFGEEK